MRYLFFLLILLKQNSLIAQSHSNKDLYKCWSEDDKLSWSDFQSKKNPLSKDDPLSDINAANAAPEISVEPITNNISGNDFLVKVMFNKSNAWVRSIPLSTPEILKHEQVHFDIAELIGRKLRMKIEHAKKLGVNIFSAKFGEEVKSILNEESFVDNLYDKETDHGNNLLEQGKWEKYVNAELSKLSKYKSTHSTCP